MADTKISALSSLTGANLDPAADVFPVVDTSVTTTKKITGQELFNALSTLTAILGAGVDLAADSFPIYDNSATTEKKILGSELAIALGVLAATSQAQQETGTSNSVSVTPGTQKYNALHPKAWGLITTPTTATVSSPAATIVNSSTGLYVVTHGQTFSSTNYAVLIQIVNASGNFYAPLLTARTATTFTIQFNDTGGATDPTAFSYTCFGDL